MARKADVGRCSRLCGESLSVSAVLRLPNNHSQLDHSTAVEYENPVKADDGVESVRDRDQTAIFEVFCNRRLERSVRIGVDRARGFIHDDASRLPDDRPGERDELTLAWSLDRSQDKHTMTPVGTSGSNVTVERDGSRFRGILAITLTDRRE